MAVRTGPAADEIQNLFSSIAGTYDRANDIITFGIARRWRHGLVKWGLAGLETATRVLDCATGTGDLAFEFKRVRPQLDVTGCDFCEPMLNVAREKVAQLQSAHKSNYDVKFEFADATSLPYADSQFDVTSIAYGIRNVSDVTKGLCEMARVTRSGGHVMILETGVVENRFLRAFVRLHFEKLVPVLGGWVSGRRSAYEYLQRSSGEFPSGQKFCDVLNGIGKFSAIEYRPLLGGASYLYRATVL